MEILKVTPNKLHVISNVRSGDLPNIDALSSSIKTRGIKVPLMVFNVQENIEVLEDQVPILQENTDNAQKIYLTLDENEMPNEYAEAEYAYQQANNALTIAKGDLNLLKDIDDPDNSYRIIDGHRRFAAGIQAGETEFPVICYIPDPDPSEIVIDQMTVGMHQETLSPLDQGQGYKKLMEMGLTKKQIQKRMGGGVSFSTIGQRVDLLKLARKAEEINSAESMDFLDALQSGDVKIQVANKAAQYVGREDLPNGAFNEMFGLALTDVKGDDFVEELNKKFGAREFTGSKKKNGVKETKGEDESPKKKNEKVNRRSTKEIEAAKNKWETLLEVGRALNAEDSSVISSEEVAFVEGIVACCDYSLGGPEMGAPDALTEPAKKLDEEEEQRKKQVLADKNKADEASKAEKKAERDKEVQRRKVHREKIKSHYNVFIAPAERKLKKLEEAVGNIKEAVSVEKDSKKKKQLESQLEMKGTELIELRVQAEEARATWHGSKEPWLVEEELKKAQKKKEKLEEKKRKAAESEDQKTEEQPSV
jgi:hypothetical protein